MQQPETSPVLGSETFWKLYDSFCNIEQFAKLSIGQTELNIIIQQIFRENHEMITKISRPEKGWGHPKAWVVLRYEEIVNDTGQIFLVLQPGDVMTREFG